MGHPFSIGVASNSHGGPNPLPPVVICPITIALLNYMGTDEIAGFFLVLKYHIFIARSDTIFIFHV